MKPKPSYHPAKVKLTAAEQAIENAVTTKAGEHFPVASQATLDSLRMAASATLAGLRGGKRPGSGRKPREHIKTTLLLSPVVRDKLEALAKETGSLSAAAEKAIMAL